MRTETDLSGFVIGVRGPSANVVLGNAQFIEALLNFDEGLKVFEYAESLSWDVQIRDLSVDKKVLNLAYQGVQGVTLHSVDLSLSQIQDLLRDVVVWVFLALSGECATL